MARIQQRWCTYNSDTHAYNSDTRVNNDTTTTTTPTTTQTATYKSTNRRTDRFVASDRSADRSVFRVKAPPPFPVHYVVDASVCSVVRLQLSAPIASDLPLLEEIVACRVKTKQNTKQNRNEGAQPM